MSEHEKRGLYARALGCAYVPYGEDSYGYVTLEAYQARKPVVTCSDSGGVLQLVREGDTGLVAEPDPEAIAKAFDSCSEPRPCCAARGERLSACSDAAHLLGSRHRTFDCMKIAWFTPLSKRSAIAEYSLWVANALAELCEVELWVSGTADSRPTDLPVIDFGVDTNLLDGLAHYDLVVYNLGNHERYHFAIYEAAQKHPGVVVLHDRVLHHFFFGYWFSRGRGSMYIRTMEAWYGAEGRRAAEDSFAGMRSPVWEDDEAVHRFRCLRRHSWSPRRGGPRPRSW